MTFRKKLYRTMEELQQDLDVWIAHYNHERTHQGKITLCQGSVWSHCQCPRVIGWQRPGRAGDKLTYLAALAQGHTLQVAFHP